MRSLLILALAATAHGAELNFGVNGAAITPATVTASTITVNVNGLVTSGGKVGIGTASPATLLHMSSGTLTIDGNTGGLKIAPALGIFAGNSISTMTPVGVLYFASTTPVVGSTATDNLGTEVYFATYTLLGNAIITPGDSFVLECAYQNSGTTLTTPKQLFNISNAGANDAGWSTVVTANVIIINRVTVTMTGVGLARYYSTGLSQVPNGATSAFLNMTDNGSYLNGMNYDWTISHTLRCAALSSGGGVTNFMWMKVSKQ